MRAKKKIQEESSLATELTKPTRINIGVQNFISTFQRTIGPALAILVIIFAGSILYIDSVPFPLKCSIENGVQACPNKEFSVLPKHLLFTKSFYPDLIGGLGLYLIASFTLYRYKKSRKKALRNTIFQNAVPLLALLNSIDKHFRKANVHAMEQEVQQDHYIAFIRTFLWANQRAQRAIDLNDTLASDTFLRLERFEFEFIFRNTAAAYELTSNFEFITERLSNKDFFIQGYRQGDYSSIEGIISSLLSDIKESHLKNDLSFYKQTLVEMLVQLGAATKDLESIEDHVPNVTHDGNRVPLIPPVRKEISIARYYSPRAINRI